MSTAGVVIDLTECGAQAHPGSQSLPPGAGRAPSSDRTRRNGCIVSLVDDPPEQHPSEDQAQAQSKGTVVILEDGDDVEVVTVSEPAPQPPQKRARPTPTSNDRTSLAGDVHILSERELSTFQPSLKAQNRELQRKIRQLEERQRALIARFPDYWVTKDHAQALDAGYRRYEINLADQEIAPLLRTWEEGGMRTHQILKVERIENAHLWRRYWQRKTEVEREIAKDSLYPEQVSSSILGNSAAKEAYWWHGAPVDSVDQILAEGFDMRVSNLNGMLGGGVYFSSDTRYSHDFSSRPAHAVGVQPHVPAWQQHQHHRGRKKGRKGAAAVHATYTPRPRHLVMLAARVVEGISATGKAGQRKPDPGCHSSTLPIQPGISRMVCCYDNSQAYPEYLFTYNP